MKALRLVDVKASEKVWAITKQQQNFTAPSACLKALC